MLQLRLRSSKKGNQHVSIPKDATLRQLYETIETQTGIAISSQKVLSGVPPKEIKGETTALLSSVGIVGNDTVTVEERPAGSNSATSSSISTSTQSEKPTEAPTSVVQNDNKAPEPPKDTTNVEQSLNKMEITVGKLGDEGLMVRRVVDSDNSCLFNSIGYCLENRNRKVGTKLREVVAEKIKKDPFTYNEALLDGKSNSQYIQWIKKDSSWGGAIELSLLSQHYRCEMAAFDIKTCVMYNYGENEGYQQRIYLLYDGIHYDAIAYSFDNGLPEEMDVTIFNTEDPIALEKAKKLVKEVNSKRQYVDTAGFTLRCGVCQVGLVGEKGALEHAKKTGHQNFSEYS